MAIYSFSLNVISRSVGGKKRKNGSISKIKTPRSCQAAAAYKRAGKVILAGQTWDYSKKKDVVPFGVYVSAVCPAVESVDLWLKADAAEKRKDATTAREGYAALPLECSPKEWAAMIHEFSAWMCETHNVAFDANYHHEPGNPHIDFQFSTREYLPDGSLGAKTRRLDDLKTGPELVEAMKAKWAAICNKHLEKYGTSIDHRSYERQGIDKLPQIHLAQAAAELEAKGIRTERGDYNRAVRRINAEQEQILLAMQELRGGQYTISNGIRDQEDDAAMRKTVSENRDNTIKSAHQLSSDLQRRNGVTTAPFNRASAGAVENRATALSGKAGRTLGSRTPASVYGTSKPECPTGKSEQRRTSSIRRDSGISWATLGAGKDCSGYASTASSILSLLVRMRQTITMQVDTANLKTLAGGEISFSHVTQVTKAIQRLTAEVKKLLIWLT